MQVAASCCFVTHPFPRLSVCLCLHFSSLCFHVLFSICFFSCFSLSFFLLFSFLCVLSSWDKVERTSYIRENENEARSHLGNTSAIRNMANEAESTQVLRAINRTFYEPKVAEKAKSTPSLQ